MYSICDNQSQDFTTIYITRRIADLRNIVFHCMVVFHFKMVENTRNRLTATEKILYAKSINQLIRMNTLTSAQKHKYLKILSYLYQSISSILLLFFIFYIIVYRTTILFFLYLPPILLFWFMVFVCINHLLIKYIIPHKLLAINELLILIVLVIGIIKDFRCLF